MIRDIFNLSLMGVFCLTMLAIPNIAGAHEETDEEEMWDEIDEFADELDSKIDSLQNLRDTDKRAIKELQATVAELEEKVERIVEAGTSGGADRIDALENNLEGVRSQSEYYRTLLKCIAAEAAAVGPTNNATLMLVDKCFGFHPIK